MEQLWKKLDIRGVTLHNRLVMPPMATAQADNGCISQRLLDYYDEKSAGGYIGLVIIEHSYVREDGKSDPGQISVSRDSDIEGLKRLADTIHKNGSKAIVQINHAGYTANQRITGHAPLCVSANIGMRTAGYCEIDEQQIISLTDAYAKAAERVKNAGFDGVELHSAHGFLMNQFYSPLANERTDDYGGSLMNRIRFHLEVIEAVQKYRDDNFLLALRLGASDYRQGGSTIEDSIAASKEFEKAGVDLLDISGGFCGFTRPGHYEPGYFGELTESIKKVVSIPVILTGGITDQANAEKLLEEKKADLIGVGRAILKDSGWAGRTISR